MPRAWAHFGVEMTDERLKALEQKRELGYQALGVMEGHLRRNDFFVAGRYSVADEGGFDLGRFPAIGAWMERIRAQPGHIPMTQG